MADPILDQICKYFGGAYDPQRRAYRTPTVAGVAQVKRSFEKVNDWSEFFKPTDVGIETGCQIVVVLADGTEQRITVPAVSGRKGATYSVQMYCFIWSTARYGEDAADFRDDLRAALIAMIRADPTLGSGGFEAGGFQVGEAHAGGAGEIRWAQDQPEADAGGGATKLFLMIEFTARSLPVG